MEEGYCTKSVKESIECLNSSEQGLGEEEAKKRLAEFGENKLVERKRASVLKMFFFQFKSFLVLLLVVAVVVSFLLGYLVDTIVIAFIVLLNAVLGFVQEYKAEKTMEALKKMSAPKARVVREGEEKIIDALLLVPGDIIVLSEGQTVPADCRLIESINLKANEASLTGESVPEGKKIEALRQTSTVLAEQKNMCFMNTGIAFGRGKGIVTATGMSTQFGKIASLVQEPKEETPLMKKLNSFGKNLGIAIVIICAFLFVLIAFARTMPIETGFLVAVSLAVAAVPEGLPAVVTITLALGMKEMARHKAVVRRISAVETLGCTTVICVDKTGTITKNELVVRKVFSNNKEFDVGGEGFGLGGKILLEGKDFEIKKERELLLLAKTGLLCNTAKLGRRDAEHIGDPTEIALLVLAKKAGIEKEGKFCSEIPFDYERKRMSSVFEFEGKKMVFCKGGIESILSVCSSIQLNGSVLKLEEKEKKKILEKNNEMASKGLRVLAFCFKSFSEKKETKQEEIEKEMVFLGMVGMIDAPRKESAEAIRICRDAGIRVIMLTGDHALTAKAIAKEIGLIGGNEKVLVGEEIDKMNEKEFEEAIKIINVFSRVSPKHKVRIVEALEKQNEVIAMSGDGVNDAPALKKADIGIAMGITGTDAAKEASDMVIEDDNFYSIVRAVREGRRVYANIRSFVKFLLAANIGEVLVIGIAILSGMKVLPLIAIQILWINLITDGLPALALGTEPLQKEIMKRKPRKKDESIILGLKGFMAVSAILFSLAVLSGFAFGTQESAVKGQAIAFSIAIFFQLLLVFNCRGNKTFLEANLLSNKFLLFSVIGSVILQALVLSSPLLQPFFGIGGIKFGLIDVGIIVLLSCIALVVPYVERASKKIISFFSGKRELQAVPQ